MLEHNAINNTLMGDNMGVDKLVNQDVGAGLIQLWWTGLCKA